MTRKKQTDKSVTLRPVVAGDRGFLLDVYASSREIELSMVPWDAAMKRTFIEHQFDAQTSYYPEHFPTATHDIVLFENEPAGRIYIDRDVELISILDMNVLNAYRNKGIGTSLLTTLKDEAAATGRRVRVYVETFNPSQQLFRQLGFEAVEDDGINILFEWLPPKT